MTETIATLPCPFEMEYKHLMIISELKRIHAKHFDHLEFDERKIVKRHRYVDGKLNYMRFYYATDQCSIRLYVNQDRPANDRYFFKHRLIRGDCKRK